MGNKSVGLAYSVCEALATQCLFRGPFHGPTLPLLTLSSLHSSH